MPAFFGIVVLAEMVEEFDRKQPRPGRATTAFIKRWREKETGEEHKSAAHLQIALRDINRAEIQSIREKKKFRDGTWRPRTRSHYQKSSKNHGGARVRGGATFSVEIRGEGGE